MLSRSIGNLNSDFSYFNFFIHNDKNNAIDASFIEERNQPILLNCEDWQIGIVRFKISLASIPLMQFEEDSYYIGFSVGENYDNIIFELINYDASLISDDTNITRNKFVYHYDQILTMINNALKSLWVQSLADANYPNNKANVINAFKFTENNPPYFRIDNTSSFLILDLPFGDPDIGSNIPVKVFSGTKPEANLINIHISPKLDYLLAGFPTLYIKALSSNIPPTPDLSYILQLDQLKDDYVEFKNTNTFNNNLLSSKQIYMRIYQDFSNLANFQDLSKLVIGTSMPVEQEQIGVASENGQPLFINILTDFEITGSETGTIRDYANYQPTYVRFINFNSNGDLRKMNLQIYYQNNKLQLFPLKLLPNQQASVKLQFKRRKAMGLLQYSASGNNLYR